VIVEARERSGALITADFALDDGREVFAVPGEITAGLATGTNRLIRQGAAPLTAVEDVLEVFDLDEAERARRAPLGEEARRVLERLSDGASSVDELARSTSVDPARLAAALVELELAGAVCEADGVYRAVMRRG
jgi:DNA processing protein